MAQKRDLCNPLEAGVLKIIQRNKRKETRMALCLHYRFFDKTNEGARVIANDKLNYRTFTKINHYWPGASTLTIF